MTPKNELLANRWAARRLVTADDLRAVAGSGLSIGEVASLLGVLPEVVSLRLSMLGVAQREALKQTA